jgi:hypothetical protein
MRHLIESCLLLVVAFACSLGKSADETAPAPAAEQAASKPTLRLLVPAYFYPAGDGLAHWDQLLTAADKVPIVAIVNPASGPGRRVDPNYVAIFDRAKQTKITLIGYVSTSYAKRTIAEAQAVVDGWLKLYPGIQGIFFDEQTSAADQIPYYESLYKYVREEKNLSLVVTNPGTVCDEGYLSRPATDVVCLFENRNSFTADRLPEWSSKYAAEHVAVLPYNVQTAEAMRACLQTAAARNVGYLYVTDDSGRNPWDRLPTWWAEEVEAVGAANRAGNE